MLRYFITSSSSLAGLTITLAILISMLEVSVSFIPSSQRVNVLGCSKTIKHSRVIMRMGLMDRIRNIGSFLTSRKGDFVKLDRDCEMLFGPGPAILLVDCPRGISKEEISDMIEDGAPVASASGVSFEKIYTIGEDSSIATDEYLDRPVLEIFEELSSNSKEDDPKLNDKSFPKSSIEQPLISYAAGCPVIYFSGISNKEMLDTYRIISSEIYEETGGATSTACAKLVEPAQQKSLKRVIEEIRSDHLDSMTSK